jgi:prepilin-type N-terminal cleavage/methylation domain-containing protein
MGAQALRATRAERPRSQGAGMVAYFSGPRCRARARRGFTLIETALTTVIVGVGVLALMEAQQAFLTSNNWSTHSTTATYLANEVREFTRKLPRHDPVTGLYFETSGSTTTLRGWGPETGETQIDDLDDIDDFDGLVFTPDGDTDPSDGDLPGPIDGFGSVIPEILADGSMLVDGQNNPLPLRGWSQQVIVDKLDPSNTSVVRDDAYFVPPNPPIFDGIAVDRFPLRVTVNVRFQGPNEAQPNTVATLVWIVP